MSNKKVSNEEVEEMCTTRVELWRERQVENFRC